MRRPVRTKIVIGTRGSELARRQTSVVVNGLQTRWADLKIEMKVIQTRGDQRKSRIVDVRAGRKGLFTGEIERALAAHEIDLAVHSAKDLPSALTPGTEIAAVLPRAPVDDVLVATSPCDLHSLAADGIVATGSVRRKHQLRWKRPDLEIVDLRGNVPTRLRKLAKDQWHAIILARAGLERLGFMPSERRINFEGSEFSTSILPREIFLPAGGQGVIAIQARSDDERLKETVEPMNDFDTRLCLRAEREFLRLLNADCNQPVGVLAIVEGTLMQIRAQVFVLEATTPREGFVEGPSEDAERLAAQLLGQINGQ
ncbi:MAG TPA: hydroxymethylbilane synthase [Chthoniobacterales bacterium]|nr:hydroxymethylbilane synthase [Chthoniobacterales bacterium]